MGETQKVEKMGAHLQAEEERPGRWDELRTAGVWTVHVCGWCICDRNDSAMSAWLARPGK